LEGSVLPPDVIGFLNQGENVANSIKADTVAMFIARGSGRQMLTNQIKQAAQKLPQVGFIGVNFDTLFGLMKASMQEGVNAGEIPEETAAFILEAMDKKIGTMPPNLAVLAGVKSTEFLEDPFGPNSGVDGNILRNTIMGLSAEQIVQKVNQEIQKLQVTPMMALSQAMTPEEMILRQIDRFGILNSIL